MKDLNSKYTAYVHAHMEACGQINIPIIFVKLFIVVSMKMISIISSISILSKPEILMGLIVELIADKEQYH